MSALAINVEIPEALPVPEQPELARLLTRSADRAAQLWAGHGGFD